LPDHVVGGAADGLRRAAPSVQGVNASAVLAFLDDAKRAGLELHNLMLWRNGAVVAEGFHWPYAATRPRMAHSMTKSVTACAIGLLIDAGRLSLDDRIVTFFPEVSLSEDARARRITVEHLLTMRTGHDVEVSGSIWRGIETSWVQEFFRIPVVHEPGTRHVYSSAASYMLSAIVSRVTGETIHAFLQPRLFAPLEMKDVRWDIGPDGINPGGNGISFTMADGMKLGILHAQRGRWEGRQVLPEWWVDAATRAHGVPDYGYHWVIGDTYYAALGVFVQMVLVYPEQNAVLGVHGAMKESKVLLPHLKRHFPTAFERTGSSAADEQLAARLASWARPPVPASAATGERQALAGRWAVTPNDVGVTAIEITFDADDLLLSFDDETGRHELSAPRDCWRETRTSLAGASLHHGYAMEHASTVVGWRWLSPDQIELTCHFVESAFHDTFVVTRTNEGLTLDRGVNINSGARAWPTLRATWAG